MTAKTRTPRTPKLRASNATVNVTTTTGDAYAPPARAIYGASHSLPASLAPSALRMFAPVYSNRTPETRRADGTLRPGARDRFFAVNIPNVTPDAARSMLGTCANILRGVLGITNAPSLPADTVDPLVTFYYANRGVHPSTQITSDADRLDFAASLGVLALNAYARATSTRVPPIGGRYGIRDASAHAAPHVLSAINATLAP